MHGIRCVLSRIVNFIFNKVIFGQHPDIRIVRVNTDRPSEGHRYGTITGEQSPPDALPQSLIGLAQLR